MPDLTEEEALALDNFVTNNEITLGPNNSDWISQREMRLLGFTSTTINYLLTKARSDHKAPEEIINELVRKEITAAL